MNILEFIEKLIKEGKSDEEISKALESNEELQFESIDVKEIAKKIYTLRKASELSSALSREKSELEATTKASENEKELEKRIDEKVNKKLKSINIDPMGKMGSVQELKRFNPRTGKVEGSHRPSEAYRAFNEMLHQCFLGRKDIAAKISGEIDFENLKVQYELEGKATPTVSDVTTRGGFAIPVEVNDEIMQLIYAQSMIMQRANTDNIIFESKIYPTINAISVDYITDQSTTLAELNPTFSDPTINMERVGGFSTISNTILAQKGSDIVNAFTTAFASSFARFLDFHLAIGNVTGAGEAQDGLVFDPNTTLQTPVALTSLTTDDLCAMWENISDEVDQASLWWIANRKVFNILGKLESTGGFSHFAEFFSRGTNFEPLGIPIIRDPKITSVLDVGGDDNTGGTDDVLILADLSKFIVGVDGETRIDTSQDFLFTDDLMTMRAIKRVGWKVIFSNVVRALELTN